MITFIKKRKLKQRCRLLAVEWIKDLSGATEEQALQFVNDSPFFDITSMFDLDESVEHNTDLAILRTLDCEFEVIGKSVAKGSQIHVNMRPGILGFRSAEHFHQLRITYALGFTYSAHLMTKIDEPVPDGFLSSTILNTEIDFLQFIQNFYRWKELPVATKNEKLLPFESYLKKLAVE